MAHIVDAQSDSALVLRAQRGDAVAFDLLVQRYRAVLVQEALTRAGDPDATEDLVQEALQRAWARLDSLRDPAAFVPWLKTIVLNAFRKWLQRRGPATPAEDADWPASPAHAPDAAVVRQETTGRLLRALARLPFENRQALLLASVNEMPYAEISQTLGLPLTTVEGRIQRARQQLRRTLGDEWHPRKLSATPPSNIPFRTHVMTTAAPTLLRQTRDGVLAEQLEAVIYLGHLRVDDAVDTLLDLLCDTQQPLRQAAAFALGRIRDARSIAPLLRAAARAHDPAGAAAREALCRYPVSAVAPPLLEAMAAPDAALRLPAIALSRHCVTPRVTAALLALLADADPRARMAAMYALDKHRPYTTLDLITPVLPGLDDADDGVRASALELLGGACPRLPALRVALRDAASSPSDLLRETAGLVLAGLPHPGPEDLDPSLLESLVDSAEHDITVCRVAAIRALGHLRAPEATALLLPLLREPDKPVRDAAVHALAALGDAAALSALLDALLDAARAAGDDVGDLTCLLAAVRSCGHRTASAWQVALDDPAARATALTLLPHCPAIDLRPTIAPLLADAGLRLVALRALDAPGDEASTTLLAPLLAPLFTAREIARPDRRPALLPALIPCLDDPDAKVRRAAAQAILTHGDAGALAPLCAALARETDGDTRQALVQAIGRLGDAGVEPLLRAALHAANGDQRIHLLHALADLRDGSGVPALVQALKRDPSPEVRAKATVLLRDLRELDAVKPLMAALQDAHDVVRERAAWALAQLHDARAVEPLIAQLHDPVEWTRSAACAALGALGDRRAVEPLWQGMQESDECPLYGVRARFRARCAMALAWLGDPRSLQGIRPLLKLSDMFVRMELEDAMTGCQDPNAKDILRELADDLTFVYTEPRPRYLGALLALAAMGDRAAAEQLASVIAHAPDCAVNKPQWWLAHVGRCDHDIDRQAIRVLVETHARQVIPAIAARLEEQERAGELSQASIALAETLLRFGDARGQTLLERMLASPRADWRCRALLACRSAFPLDVPGLAARLAALQEHDDPVTRVLAGQARLARGHADGIDPLVAAYADTTLGLARKLAAAAFGDVTDATVRARMRQSPAMAVAREELRGAGIAERLMAVLALTAGAPPDAGDLLSAALVDPSSRVQAAAITALGRLGDPARIPALKKLLRHPSPRLRGLALQALGAIGDRRAVPHIIKLMEHEPITTVTDIGIAVLKLLQ